MSDKVNIEVNNNNLQDIRVDFFPFLSKVQSSQIYTFNFQPDSAKYNAQTVAAGGKIAGIGGPSGTKVFKSISTSPYQQQVGKGDSVAEGDILTVELDATPTAKETVEIIVSYADTSSSVTFPSKVGAGGHAYAPDTNGNVTVIDIVNRTEIKTLTPNNPVDSVAFRNLDQTVYGFGSGHFIVIDADPNSSNFNTIIKQSNNFPQAQRSFTLVTYDHNKDLFVIDSRRIIIFDPVSEQSSNKIELTAIRDYSVYVSGVGHLKPTRDGDGTSILNDYSVNGLERLPYIFPSLSGTFGSVLYNYKNGLFYEAASNGQVFVRNMDNGSAIAVINTGHDRRGGGACFAKGKVFFGPKNVDQRITVIDTVNNTFVGAFDSWDQTGGNHVSQVKDMKYSPVLDRVVFLARMTNSSGGYKNAVKFLDPNKSISNMYDGEIVLSADHPGRGNSGKMTLNQLDLVNQIDW